VGGGVSFGMCGVHDNVHRGMNLHLQASRHSCRHRVFPQQRCTPSCSEPVPHRVSALITRVDFHNYQVGSPLSQAKQ